jgi:hypothetical protein
VLLTDHTWVISDPLLTEQSEEMQFTPVKQSEVQETKVPKFIQTAAKVH